MTDNDFQSSNTLFTPTVLYFDDIRVRVLEGGIVMMALDDENYTVPLRSGEALALGGALLEAADTAGNPAAHMMCAVLQGYVEQRTAIQQADDDELDDDDDISPEDRLEAAAGMERLVADMRAAGAATVGEFFEMKKAEADRAGADGQR